MLQINYMSDLKGLIKDPVNSILFFDIDNTTMKIEHDICSAEWIHWQMDIHNNDEHPDKNYKIGSTIIDVYMQNRKLMTKCNFDHNVVENNTIELIDELIKDGAIIVFLTARNRCLENLTIDWLKKFYPMDKINHTHDMNNIDHSCDTYYYKNGVFFASGINKAVCIDFFMKNITLDINNNRDLYLIDDSEYEISRAIKYSTENNMKLNLVHYTYSKKFQNDFNKLCRNYLHNKYLLLANN